MGYTYCTQFQANFGQARDKVQYARPHYSIVALQSPFRSLRKKGRVNGRGDKWVGRVKLSSLPKVFQILISLPEQNGFNVDF